MMMKIPHEIWVHNIWIFVLDWSESPQQTRFQFSSLCRVCKAWARSLLSIGSSSLSSWDLNHDVNQDWNCSYWAALIASTMNTELASSSSSKRSSEALNNLLKDSPDWRILYLKRTLSMKPVNEMVVTIAPQHSLAFDGITGCNYVSYGQSSFFHFKEPAAPTGLLLLLMTEQKTNVGEELMNMFKEEVSQPLVEQLNEFNENVFSLCQAKELVNMYKHTNTIAMENFYPSIYPNQTREQVIEEYDQNFMKFIVQCIRRCEDNLESEFDEQAVLNENMDGTVKMTFEEFEEFVNEHCPLIIQYSAWFDIIYSYAFAIFTKNGKGFMFTFCAAD
ncbi:hypothetical protein C9374_010539 [Naegleria lovaniensis]|uniref:Uncharacterized protein n=1 Tax=Naegleria lovaniensis TaxID=51637 RepID=A0AA88KDK7_NAELO|nr:uncharacterized protein C9374_010539 [Naegleria lovaniensis]KAG2374795.1 hypothetical protein C9374_010539 [Naegleria lovaniensis]